MWLHAGRRQAGDQLAARLLAGADDDVVDGENAALAGLRDLEATIVDALVSDAREHAHAATLEREAMHPAGSLAEIPAGRRRLALQQPDLPRRARLRRGDEAAARGKGHVDAP